MDQRSLQLTTIAGQMDLTDQQKKQEKQELHEQGSCLLQRPRNTLLSLLFLTLKACWDKPKKEALVHHGKKSKLSPLLNISHHTAQHHQDFRVFTFQPRASAVLLSHCSWSLWSVLPSDSVPYGYPTAMQKDARRVSTGLQKCNTAAKEFLWKRNQNKEAGILYLVPSATLEGHASIVWCKGNDLHNCLREQLIIT